MSSVLQAIIMAIVSWLTERLASEARKTALEAKEVSEVERTTSELISRLEQAQSDKEREIEASDVARNSF